MAIKVIVELKAKPGRMIGRSGPSIGGSSGAKAEAYAVLVREQRTSGGARLMDMR